MIEIMINLKRFDVPRELGGVCPFSDPQEWIESVMKETIKLGIGKEEKLHLTYFLPEALILSAINILKKFPKKETININIGCQGVFRKDIESGENFGAFTTNLPATAAKNLGSTWAIIGHSEERTDKIELIEQYDGRIKENCKLKAKVKTVVDNIINQEILCALKAGLNVLVCVGETAEEKGPGDFAQQKTRIQTTLNKQLVCNLNNIKNKIKDRQLIIGYEPIWAIGPGKTPPGKEYISFVSSYIKETVLNKFNFEPTVIYGGGLKSENAGMLAQINSINGGLIALTKFSGEIGFSVQELKKIIQEYAKNVM